MPLPNLWQPDGRTIATSHGITIYLNGVSDPIGMIQTWAPAQTRGATAVYELNASTSGDVVAQVPGNVGGLTIRVTRYDLFRDVMESVWGFTMNMLSDQTNPITIRERLESFSGPTGRGADQIKIYQGCWFTSLGRNLSVTGDRLIMVDAALAYTRIRKMA